MTIDSKTINDGFDAVFFESALSTQQLELFEMLGIKGFVEECMLSKKHGFNASKKILADVTKISFAIYENLENLPLQKKIILPEQNGFYKFIVARGCNPLFIKMLGKKASIDMPTSALVFACTGDDAHATIAEKLGLYDATQGVYVFGGARIDINYDDKVLTVSEDSGSFGSLSNELLLWMLEEFRSKGYTVTSDMKDQRMFFD